MSIPNQDAYLEMSDMELSAYFHILRQDFCSKAISIMIERERRLQDKISNLNIKTKNTVWDTSVIKSEQKVSDDNAAVVKFQMSEMKNYYDELKEKLYWFDIENDKNREKEDEYSISVYKNINRSSGNKNWVYKKKTERHPKQKKIEKTLRSKKKLQIDQKKERYLRIDQQYDEL